jgi:hypothetical protein
VTPLNPATLAFPFGAVDQAKGTRHLLAGELTEASNVRMVKEDEWRKRPGFDRNLISLFSGSTHSGTPKEFAIVAGAEMWRDGTDQVWVREPDSNTAYYRGRQRRAFPNHFAVNRNAASNEKPLVVLAGEDLWVFQREIPWDPFLNYSPWSWTVYDATTKVMKRTTATYTVAGTQTVDNWAAAYDSVSGYVWLMIVSSSTVITAYRFTASSPTTGPTPTVYRTVAGMAFNTIDIKKLNNGEFLVVASSFTTAGTHTCYFEHSYLNTATGLAKTSPGFVGITTSPASTTPRCCTGIRILAYDGANGTAYYALWRTKAGVANTVQLVLCEVDATTLAMPGAIELVAETVTQVANPIVGVCSGYRSPTTGSRVVYSQIDHNDTSRPGVLRVDRYTWNGSTSVSWVAARHAVLLSDPFPQGDEFYFVTGYDDGQTAHAQRTYYLRNQDGTLASVFLSGEGAAAWHRSVGRDSGGGVYTHNTGFVNALVNPATGKWLVAVAAEDSANGTTLINMVELDFSATYAPPVVVDDVVVYAGPIPQVAGPRDDLHDLSPLLYPSLAPTFVLGTGAFVGNFQVCYRYRFKDASGRFYRSAPSPIASAAFNTTSVSITCQSLQHTGRGAVGIEIYGSVAGGTDMFLQTVVANNFNENTTVWYATAASSPLNWGTGGELLDTAGGALTPAPPPPCRCAALWRGRLFLSGTPSPQEIWFSKELQAGRGPEFNEVLVTEWGDGTGAPTLMQPSDWNYLSVHKADAVGVLSGPGPDGRGAGGYVVATLAGKKAGRVGSAVTGPAGCYFQNLQDGRICLLPPGAPAIDIGRGVEAFKSAFVHAALHVESERQIWFFLNTSYILVLHYAFPTASSPYGRWSTYVGARTAAGAAMSGTAPRFIEASTTVVLRTLGTTFRDTNETTSDVLTKLKLERLRPAGHQQEFMLDRAYFEGQHIGASTLRITITNDLGQAEQFTRAATTTPLDYMVTPGAQTLRTKEFSVTIEEAASGLEGFVYDTFAADIKTVGKIKTPNAGDWIAPG